MSTLPPPTQPGPSPEPRPAIDRSPAVATPRSPAGRSANGSAYLVAALTLVAAVFVNRWIVHRWGVIGLRNVLLVLGPLCIAGLLWLMAREIRERRVAERASARVPTVVSGPKPPGGARPPFLIAPPTGPGSGPAPPT